MLHFINELTDGTQSLNEAETATRVQALIRAGIQYTTWLHHHHHAESSMLFPVLKREDPAITPVVDRLKAEHDEIAVLIDKFGDAVRVAATVDLRVLDTDLRRLADALQAHLAYEETHVCPLLSRLSGWPF
jgi:hemerythrin-like domain-containing protein